MSQSAIISKELKELNSILPAGLAADYAVPDGYFESFAGSMLQRIGTTLTNERFEDELPISLRGIDNRQVYRVPDDYFSGLDASFVFLSNMDAREEIAQLSPLMNDIGAENVYRIPADYFSGLDLSFVFAGELDSKAELSRLSPFLGNIPRKSPFSLPDGYLEQPVIRKEDERPAPVMKMNSPGKWYRFAVAASIVAIIGLAAFLWRNQYPSGTAAERQSFAWVEKNMKKVSTEDISRFVDLTDPLNDVASVGTPDDIKGLLKNVSDKEIQDFLKDIPVDETDDADILFN